MRATQIKYNKWNEETINGFRNVAPFKNRDFEVPEYKAPVPDQEEDLIKKAADEGFDLLPDGTREKITWRMKYSLVRKRMVPELVMVEHTRLDELILIKRGFWKEPKFKAPPNPQPPDPGEKEISEEIFCPF
jgi:hypothetical protein